MEAAVYRAKVTTGYLASALYTYAIVHVLKDLRGDVDAGGFHDGILWLMLRHAKLDEIPHNE